MKGEELAPGQSFEQQAVCRIAFYDEAHKPLSAGHIGPWQGTFAWTRQQAIFPVPRHARVAIVWIGLMGGTGRAWFDDVSVEPADVPPDVPRLRQVHFDGDGQFQARVLRNHRLSSLAGTYRFTGGRLVLTPDGYVGAGPFDYTAQLAGRVLSLKRGVWTYHLGREPAGSLATQPPLPVLGPVETQPAATSQPVP